MQLACVECAGAFLVVASAMGQARAPAWQHNLEATPEAWVQLRGERVRVRAELLSDAEKQACWEEIRRQLPQIRVYETRTDRNIRVIRLRRIHDAGPRDDPSARPPA